MRSQPAPTGGNVEEGTPQPPHPTSGAKKSALSKRARLWIVIAAVLGIAAAAGGLVYAFVIRPAQDAGEAALPETLDVTFEAPFQVGGEAEEGVLRLSPLSADLQTKKEVPVSGGAQVPELATGIVTIINTSAAPQELVERTRLLSSEGVLFRLRTTVTVPENGRVEARVVADQPGATGNVAAGRFTIPGLPAARQAEVYGESAAPMSGGVRQTGQITEADIQRTLDAARNELALQALAAWREDLAPGQLLLAEPLAIRITSSAVPEPAPASGSPVSVEIAATVVGAAAGEDALRLLADAAAAEQAAADAAGAYTYTGWQLTTIAYDDAAGTGRLTVRVSAERQ